MSNDWPKEKFDVGKTLPNMLDGSNPRPRRQIQPYMEPIEPEGASWKRRLGYAFLAILFLVLVTGGWLAYKFQRDCSKVFKDCTVFSLFYNAPLKGEDVGRVNILLAGNSVDDPGHSGAQLTDSIMLISLDTHNNTGYMLSIPRDLYVNIPGSGYEKINAAYEDGQAQNFQESGYPNGGMGLLEKIVSQDFGVPIDYYALISYNAFRDSVNAVGGIDVTINSPDGRLYDPNKDWTTGGPLVNLSNGVHTLNGEQALDFARARGDPNPYGEPIGFELSDYQRTQDQRMMLTSLKDKATSLGVLANPIKLGDLLDAAGNNVQTDFSGSNIRRLASITKKIPDNKIQSVGLNNYNGRNYLASYGGSLIPAAGLDDFSQFQTLVQNLNQQ